MKRILMCLTTAVVLLTGVNFADAAKSNDNFTVRFRENTLVVTSTQMEEARIYSMQGKLLLCYHIQVYFYLLTIRLLDFALIQFSHQVAIASN